MLHGVGHRAVAELPGKRGPVRVRVIRLCVRRGSNTLDRLSYQVHGRMKTPPESRPRVVPADGHDPVELVAGPWTGAS